MLHEIGVDSYYVAINTQRGSITSETPAYQAFNHVIIAIKLPPGVSDPSLIATMQHPRLGKILFFDPRNEFTPLGQIGGYFQPNSGLLVPPTAGDLVELLKKRPPLTAFRRTPKLP